MKITIVSKDLIQIRTSSACFGAIIDGMKITEIAPYGRKFKKQIEIKLREMLKHQTESILIS